MKYYDVSLIEVPAWYGFDSVLKPEIIEAKTIQELKSKTQNRKGFIVLKHPSEEVFRHAIEKALVDAVLPQRKGSHDYFHYRRTIIDLVSAKLMSKNKITLIFSLKELKETHGIERAIIWGRMSQEALTCIKKKVPVIIASMAENEEELIPLHSLIGFAELLGLNPKALNYAQEKIMNRA